MGKEFFYIKNAIPLQHKVLPERSHHIARNLGKHFHIQDYQLLGLFHLTTHTEEKSRSQMPHAYTRNF